LSSPRRARIVDAFVTALVTALATLIVIWIVTLFIGASLADALRSPEVWVVESTAIMLAAAATLTRSERDVPHGATDPRPRTLRVVGTRLLAAVAIALTIGAGLALATDTPVLHLWSSIEFLITATIAVGIAVLEGLPSKDNDD
jgi:hypothetical protein